MPINHVLILFIATNSLKYILDRSISFKILIKNYQNLRYWRNHCLKISIIYFLKFFLSHHLKVLGHIFNNLQLVEKNFRFNTKLICLIFVENRKFEMKIPIVGDMFCSYKNVIRFKKKKKKRKTIKASFLRIKFVCFFLLCLVVVIYYLMNGISKKDLKQIKIYQLFQ